MLSSLRLRTKLSEERPGLLHAVFLAAAWHNWPRLGRRRSASHRPLSGLTGFAMSAHIQCVCTRVQAHITCVSCAFYRVCRCVYPPHSQDPEPLRHHKPMNTVCASIDTGRSIWAVSQLMSFVCLWTRSSSSRPDPCHPEMERCLWLGQFPRNLSYEQQTGLAGAVKVGGRTVRTECPPRPGPCAEGFIRVLRSQSAYLGSGHPAEGAGSPRSYWPVKLHYHLLPTAVSPRMSHLRFLEGQRMACGFLNPCDLQFIGKGIHRKESARKLGPRRDQGIKVMGEKAVTDFWIPSGTDVCVWKIALVTRTHCSLLSLALGDGISAARSAGMGPSRYCGERVSPHPSPEQAQGSFPGSFEDTWVPPSSAMCSVVSADSLLERTSSKPWPSSGTSSVAGNLRDFVRPLCQTVLLGGFANSQQPSGYEDPAPNLHVGFGESREGRPGLRAPSGPWFPCSRESRPP